MKVVKNNHTIYPISTLKGKLKLGFVAKFFYIDLGMVRPKYPGAQTQELVWLVSPG